MEGSTGKHGKAGKRREGLSTCVCLLIPELGGSRRLPDKVCFADTCRNRLDVLWHQNEKMLQEHSGVVAQLTEEISTLRKVILQFGEEGLDEQGPPQSPSWVCWWGFPAYCGYPSLGRGSLFAQKSLLLARLVQAVSARSGRTARQRTVGPGRTPTWWPWTPAFLPSSLLSDTEQVLFWFSDRES